MAGNPQAKRRRRTLGTLMGFVAALAVAFAMFKPYTPATSAAIGVLNRLGYDANQYLAFSTGRTPSGYWRVQFVRVAGPGNPTITIIVPDAVVSKARDSSR